MLIINCLIIITSCSLKQVKHYIVFIIARILGGIATGISSVLVPMFIKEITSTSNRGPLIALTQQMITIGIFAWMTISDHLPRFERSESGEYWATFDGDDNYWRLLFGFPISISIFQLLMLLFVFKKENPSYYESEPSSPQENQPNEESDLSLITTDSRSWIQNNSENSSTIIAVTKPKDPDTYKSFITLFSKRRALISGIIALVFQQLSGVNLVFQYSDYFYVDNNDKDLKIKYLLGIVNMVATFLSLYFCKVFKRKRLFLIGFIITWAWNCLLFQTFEEDVSSKRDVSSNLYNLLVIFIMIAFIVAFSLTLGSVSWVYATEVLTLKGMSIAVFWHWTCNWFIAYLPTLAINLKLAGGSRFTGEYVAVFFFLFSGLSMCGFFLIIVFAKETFRINYSLIPERFKNRRKRYFR